MQFNNYLEFNNPLQYSSQNFGQPFGGLSESNNTESFFNVFFADESESTGTSTTTSQSTSTDSSPIFDIQRSQETLAEDVHSLAFSGFLQLAEPANSSFVNPEPENLTAAQSARQKRKRRINKQEKPKKAHKPGSYTAEDLADPIKGPKIQKRMAKNREAAQKSRDRKKALIDHFSNQDQQLQALAPQLEGLVRQYCQTFPQSYFLHPETQETDQIDRIYQIVETMMVESIATNQEAEIREQALSDRIKQLELENAKLKKHEMIL